MGTNVHAGNTLDVTLSPAQRSRHMYVIGASGTGKSTLLLNLIMQDMVQGQGFGVLDPHGDLIDDILARVPEDRMEDVVVFDPSDAKHPIGFNILSAQSELEKTLLASDLVVVFRRLSTSWGDQMNTVLANAILAIVESEEGGTLFDLRRFLIDPAFRRQFLLTVTDDEVLYYWRKEFPLLTRQPHAPILTRLNTFLRPKLIRYMVAQKESLLDLATVMNSGKIFLAKLAQGAIGEENAYLLGSLLVAKFQQLALGRQELTREKRRPFYLYIDEFHNFICPSMSTILSSARKYQLALVLAHQDLRQLSSRNPEVMDAVLTNPCVRVCFRVGDADARTLAGGFSIFDRSDLQSLGIGQAIARVDRADCDFNLDTLPPPAFEGEKAEVRRQEVIATSRAKYTRPREDIERLLESYGEIAREQIAAPKPETTSPADPRRKPEANRVRSTPPKGIQTPTPGRGGQQHKYLQELIKRWADTHGWRATIEAGILNGLGSVDVALQKGDRSVACEITVTTTPDHELGNIQKCLAAGFGHVVVVSTRKGTLNKIRSLARESLPNDEFSRLVFGQPEELFALLEGFDAEAADIESTVKGYKVRVQYKSVGEKEKQVRRQAVSQIIAKALGRLKRDDS